MFFYIKKKKYFQKTTKNHIKNILKPRPNQTATFCWISSNPQQPRPTAAALPGLTAPLRIDGARRVEGVGGRRHTSGVFVIFVKFFFVFVRALLLFFFVFVRALLLFFFCFCKGFTSVFFFL